MTAPRNPKVEAQRLVGEGHAARVLEPSPPAVGTEPFFADDPVSVEPLSAHTTAVMPAGMTGGIDWNEWLVDNPQHSDWVKTHWLGGARRLPPLPPMLATTRVALHKLGVYAIAPARHRDNGKFGLRYTHGGFGTPFFGNDRQIRVEGNQLVDQTGSTVRTQTITSLADAAAFLGCELDFETAAEHDSPPAGDVNAILSIDADAAHFLGAWFGMAFAALEVLRADPDSVDPARPQLWPGHFDPAIEIGDQDHRGSYGASPGDSMIAEPYLYVSIWWPDRVGFDKADRFWNAEGFSGAALRVSEFPPDDDPVEIAVDFWRSARDRLG